MRDGLLVRDVLLRDGSTLRLQASRPSDVDEIKSFYDGLSWRSRYFRFGGYPRTDLAARAEANAGGVDRLALIGRHSGRIVACARYDTLREKGAAEVSFAVADAFRQRGIGTRMLEQLAKIAAGRGIHRFDAHVMAENAPMLAVFEHGGFAVRREDSSGEVTASLEIALSEAVQQRVGERDHAGAVAALRSVLAPSSIAVVGSPTRAGSLEGLAVANICAGGFRGDVFPVDPAGGLACSIRAARSLRELPVTPELVIVAAVGEELLRHVAGAAACGARAVLALAAGGDENRATPSDHEERLLEILRGSGLRMVGPGSLGVVNTDAAVSLNATFSGARVRPGGLAIGSHGVALGLGLLGHAAARELGVSSFVSLGGCADVSTSDLLEWCAEDARTSTVMLYVESLGDPRRFTRVAKRVSRKKPSLVLSGSSRPRRAREEGQSQTAAALRGDQIVDAVMQHAGVLRFRSGEELFQATELFETQPLPRGREIGILSNSAAVAMLAGEACATRRLNVGPANRSDNPLVLGFDAGPADYEAGIHQLLGDPAIDALIVCHVEPPRGSSETIMAGIAAACARQPKPAVACVVGADGRLPALTPPRVPNFLFPESCAAALARAAGRRSWLSRPVGERPGHRDIDTRAARGMIDGILEQQPAGGWVEPEQLEGLLATHGIAVAGTYRAGDLDQALAAAETISGPLALKADLRAPSRASEIDAVLLGLHGEPAIRSGWHELQHCVQAAGRQWTGAIVQALAEPGADVLVGTLCDPDVGTVLAVGLGGRQAGAGEAAAFRLPPATDIEADELIDACEPVASELDSFPGTAPLDRGALRELVLRFARLVDTVPEIAEADLNTIRCTSHGCTVLDARLRIAPLPPMDDIKTW